MKTTQIEQNLRDTLRLKTGTSDTLNNRENSHLEFKRSFSLGSRGKYTRSMAAFANNDGGYIVFGVENNPHVMVSINEQRFNSVDPVEITQFLNTNLSPEILWEMGIIDVFGFRLGYIFTFEATEKPVVTTKNSGSDLKEGDIYYRYRGQSRTIKYPELRSIIDERLQRERRAWIQHVKRITEAGSTNIAVIDTIQGKVFGGGPPFLIDEKLLDKLRFIREGAFSETDGPPTLKLVGELRTLSGVKTERLVRTGIHYSDLVTVFLGATHLEQSQAKSYIREACYLPSAYVPIFYYIHLAGLSESEAGEILESESSGFRSTCSKLLERLSGDLTITAGGSLDDEIPTIEDRDNLLSLLNVAQTAKERRALLFSGLKNNPQAVHDAIQDITPSSILEAVLHLTREYAQSNHEILRQILLDIFNLYFDDLASSTKTTFRKAVAYLDELLFRNGGLMEAGDVS